MGSSLSFIKYTSSPRQDHKIFLASICHAIIDPPVTKIRLWASFGVWITTRWGTIQKTPFLTIFTPKNRENLHCLFWFRVPRFPLAIDRAWSN